MDPSFLLLMMYFIAPLLALAALYWVVRLAVRHGVREGLLDAEQDRAARGREQDRDQAPQL